MEHDVYICSWLESAAGFEVWVKSRPQVRARGKTYLEAQEALLGAILKAGGAYQAVLEFVPPFPRSEVDTRYSSLELYIICGDDRFETDEPCRVMFESENERSHRLTWYDDFFVAQICRECLSPGGPRSERPVTITHARSGYDGGFVVLAGATLQIFSEDFLMLLTNDERQNLNFRLVNRSSRSRKQLFELVGPSGPSPVAIAGREANGWRCTACGARVFGYHYESATTTISSYVAAADLTARVRPVFTIGAQPSISLCVTAERWASMVGKRGTRGLVSRLIGVVPDNEVVRIPDLKPRNA
jgi:hypothetical protein